VKRVTRKTLANLTIGAFLTPDKLDRSYDTCVSKAFTMGFSSSRWHKFASQHPCCSRFMHCVLVQLLVPVQ
jgi:hypothetical protein